MRQNILKLRLFAWIVPGLAFFVAGCATPLSGVLSNAEGTVLKGITLQAYGPRQEPTGQRKLLAETITGDDGSFKFPPWQGERPELLALIGSQGTGRVHLARTSKTMALTYPVRSTLALLHDNDLHFNANHEKQFAANIAAARRLYDNVLLFHAGDLFNRYEDAWGSPTHAAYAARSRKMIAFLNRNAYDAMTPGNHDLDYVDNLTRQALECARCPILAANLDLDTPCLPTFEPYKVFHLKNDQTVAVLGLSNVNFDKPGVKATAPIVATAPYITLAESNTLFIGLTHIGYNKDVELAKKFPEFDLIMGGHSHTLLPVPPIVNGVLVAQAGGTGCHDPHYKSIDPLRPKYLGVVLVDFENDRVVGKQGRVMEFSEAPSLRTSWDFEANAADFQLPVAATGVTLRAVLGVINPTLLNAAGTIFYGGGTDISKWEKAHINVPGGKKTLLPMDIVNLKPGKECVLQSALATTNGRQFPGASLRLALLPFLGQINADGDLSDWGELGLLREIRGTDIKVFPKQTSATWSGEIRAGWNTEGFCFGVRIHDAAHKNTKTGSDIWNGDAIQFALTLAATREQDRFGKQDLLGGLALTDKGEEFFKWIGPEIKGLRHGIKRDESSKTTTYECVIPMQELGALGKPGETLAFNIVVLNDNNGNGATTWFELAPGIVFGQNPMAFPIYILCK